MFSEPEVGLVEDEAPDKMDWPRSFPKTSPSLLSRVLSVSRIATILSRWVSDDLESGTGCSELPEVVSMQVILALDEPDV